MSDEITSLCVLAPMGGHHFNLYHVQRKSDGSEEHSYIPCHEEGTPRPGFAHCWKFRRNGSRLDFTPSVNNLSSGFHNGGAWSVECVEINPDLAEFDAARIHQEINLGNPIDRGRRIAELVEEGTLLPWHSS